ncbi:unnamed protein product [Mytilus coruscus]|uniref:CCHC-type domain-containing protein n=1 Tax=Mytilus coruscus TaxID=42192 RepID=A0A6J8D7A2_MYTCO|nr:unnamed protein product [Mytilus coruscus]
MITSNLNKDTFFEQRQQDAVNYDNISTPVSHGIFGSKHNLTFVDSPRDYPLLDQSYITNVEDRNGQNDNTLMHTHQRRDKQYKKQKDPDTYDGKHAEWPDYICHFEQVALWNQWSEYEMASQLAMCLRGIAQRALSELSRDDLSNYWRLKFSLTQRFARLKEKNSLSLLAAHAFPTIPLNIRESLIIEQYISGLANPGLKRHVQFSHPTTLDRAISLALEFEAFEGSQISPVIKKPQDEDLISPICTSINVNEKVDQNCSQSSIFTKLVEGMQEVQKSMMESLQGVQKSMETMLQKQNDNVVYRGSRQNKDSTNRSKIQCFYCKEEGHYKRDCPALKNKSYSRSQSQDNGTPSDDLN